MESSPDPRDAAAEGVQEDRQQHAPQHRRKEEADYAKQIAKRKGISEEEAATLIVKASIARRVRKRTGKSPAKVYSIKKR